MFGYVRVYTPELRMREHEFYRAAYCGLCRANGKRTGCASRFTLNYDMVFLALVRLALTGETPSFKYRRCAAHPTKKRNEMIPGEQLEFCALAGALLTYHKLCDDYEDERGSRRARAAFGLMFARKMRRRAAAELPALDAKIEAGLRELSELENSRCASVDLPAEVFGRITSDILSFGLADSAAAVARQIGIHVGKWIYIADALDDYDDDIKRGRYNPFALLWLEGMAQSERERIGDALTHELIEAGLGFDLLEYGGPYGATLSGVIENIIYGGMPKLIEKIVYQDRIREDIGTDERSI